MKYFFKVCRAIINAAAYQYNTEKRKLEERDTYGKAFLQIMNLWEVDEQVKKMVGWVGNPVVRRHRG